MKREILIAAFMVLLITASQAQPGYHYSIDLTRVVDDRVFVELKAPKITEHETVFYLPKIIPGTYAVADYGRFIHDLAAFDQKGRRLEVEKVNANGWKIKNASRLNKITYWVEDILDAETEGPHIYPMAATNIEEGKNFVINTSGFFGYFENNKDLPVQLEVIRSRDHYGSTGLIPTEAGAQLPKVKKEIAPQNEHKRIDRYYVENYDRLIDSPLMYAEPDTAIIRVANTEVLIGSYSPTGKINAKEIAGTIREVLVAQSKYLGGKLPVDKYAFIFYFTDKPINAYGALEHWYSSFYYMPERTIDAMKQQLRDFAAHEFFHIVTPLNIHSKEIHRFEFNNPEMSKHLWMYEGVTEYFAGNVQVKYGLITPDQYLGMIRQKMLVADQFLDDVPFTDISKYTLDKYSDQYYNVYQKGALIGMCLDIKLRTLSNGKYGLQDLMADLAKEYGKDQAFDDDELFGKIEQLTYPEIGDFLRSYIDGTKRLPFSEVFEAVGVNYEAEKPNYELNIGFGPAAIGVTEVDGKKKLMVSNTNGLTEQGKLLGLKVGDVLISINGKAIPDLGPGIGEFFDKAAQGLHEGETLSYSILRKDSAGALQPLELKAKVITIDIVEHHILSFDDDISPEKLLVRKAWLTAE
ncbi:MAG: peptidase M61 [Cyclobacteriaceae bacterium]|nr:peptidase M61 [Cyclobacteriaceae bacterium]